MITSNSAVALMTIKSLLEMEALKILENHLGKPPSAKYSSTICSEYVTGNSQITYRG